MNSIEFIEKSELKNGSFLSNQSVSWVKRAIGLFERFINRAAKIGFNMKRLAVLLNLVKIIGFSAIFFNNHHP